MMVSFLGSIAAAGGNPSSWQEWWEKFLNGVLSTFSFLDDKSLQQKLIPTIVLILLVFGLRLIITAVIGHHVVDVKRKYYFRRFVGYTQSSVIIIGLAWIWFGDSTSTKSIAQALGIVGAGLAVAMHDTVSNFTGWVFILWRKPLRVGERIEIDGVTGDVIDIRMLEFSMIEVGGVRLSGNEQSTGRILHVPNGMVLRQKVANYDTAFSHIWDEIPILVTFESDWEKAKELLSDIVNRHVEQFSRNAESGIRRAAQKYMIYSGKLTPIVYTSIEASGILLTMRFMVTPRQRRGVRQAIFEDVLRAFSKQDSIEFAYPTVRYYANHIEGKVASDLGAPGPVPPR